MVLRALGILLWAALLPAQEVHLQILETTDVRGHVLPVDTFTLQPASGGWARLGTLIRILKTQNPATVLVDSGDGTQGEPLNYVATRLRPEAPEPTMALMNSLGYSAMVVGHLELDQGLARVRAMEEQAQFPWLAANVYFAGTRKHAFTPYLKMEVGGVPVAVLGLVAAPAAGLDGTGGLDFQDPVACARELIPQLREREQVDFVVLACHGDQVLPLLADPSVPEREVLGAFRCNPTPTVLHHNPVLMPPQRRGWASWNFRAQRDADRLVLSYHMNRLQPLATRQDWFVSLHAEDLLDPATIAGRYAYEHPRFDREALRAQARWAEVSGPASVQGRTHYAGAYWGYGFHECGVQSGIKVARDLGVSW